MPIKTNDTPVRKSVFILSAPRTTSTLLIRLLANDASARHQGCKTPVMLEPFTQAFYLQPNQSLAPEFHLKDAWPKTGTEAKAMIRTASDKFMVIKDLAYQCEPFLDDDFIQEMLTYIEPIFLIRSPKATTLSALDPYYKNQQLDEFSAQDVGFVELQRLFDRFSHHMQRRPLVIESER